MAHLQRLTYWLIAAVIYVLFGAITEVHAEDYPVSIQWTFEPANASGFDENALFPTRDAACDAARIYTEQTRGYTIPTFTFIDPESDNTPRCTGNKIAPEPQAPQFYIGEGHRQFLCLGGGTYNPTTQLCTGASPCPEGQTRGADGTCSVPPPTCDQTQGDIVGPATLYVGQSAPPLACLSGCQYAHHETTPPSIDCGTAGAMICKYTTDVSYIGVGASCSDELPLPESVPPQPNCPECQCAESGGSWGTVNGVGSCLPRGAPGTEPIKTELPPTVKSETPAPTPENPDPEPVVTTTPGPVITIRPAPPGAPAGSPPEVEQTTKNPDGSSSTVTTSLPQFCEANPNNAVCKKGNGGGGGLDPISQWGGACDAFTCTGDAIQCAIARRIHQNRCEDRASLEPYQVAIDKGDALLKGELGTDVDAFIAREGEHSRNVDLPTELSETGQASLGSGGLSDLTVSVLGQSVVIPFSKLNSILEMLGFVILAVAYVSALRIVGVF